MQYDLGEELAGLRLPDARLNVRARRIVSALQERPRESFPDLFDHGSRLEAFYRFTNNARVSASALLAPHRDRAWERGSSTEEATLVLHDTTCCSFTGQNLREGLPIEGQKQTLYVHTALAVAEGRAPVVHGVVGLGVYTVRKGRWHQEFGGGESEELCLGSERWRDLAREVRQQAPPGQKLIHVMDREADEYLLLGQLAEQGDGFVVRSQHDRRLEGPVVRLTQVLKQAPALGDRPVRLSERKAQGRAPKTRKTHPERPAREAVVEVSSAKVKVQRPESAEPLGQPTEDLWVVEVLETQPPPGEEPVHWRLLTNLPADTEDAAWRVVDLYRKRWLIEEWFKALKTGCGFEKRQAETLDALMRVLALLVPVAWRLLMLRAMERMAPEAPAEEVFQPMELTVLRELGSGPRLPERPTVREAMQAVARMGGHLKSNGAPGGLVLGRGLEKLLTLVDGWEAALSWMAASRPGGTPQTEEGEM